MVTKVRTIILAFKKPLLTRNKETVVAHERVAEFEAFSVRDDHKNANEQIGKSLSSVAALFGVLASSIGEIAQTMTQETTLLVRGVKQQILVSDLQNQETRARNYTTALNSLAKWDTVEYNQAVTNAKFISQVEQRKSEYEQKIADGIRRLNEEEKEKERIIKEWAATKDTLAAKKDHIASLLTELAATRQKYKDALSNAPSEHATGPTLSNRNLGETIDLDNMNSDTGNNRGYKITVIDENAEESSSLQVTKIDRERENALKQHFQSKRAQLLAQMKIADEKAVKYYEEYQRVSSELKAVSEQNQTRKEALEAAQAQQLTAMEDLESTRRNYEDQMKVMTEHFMSLNDKLGKQEDSLTRLKNHKVHCARCGTWNTVAWLIGPDGLNGRRCSRGNHPSSYNYS